jgi:hypothetical protein
MKKWALFLTFLLLGGSAYADIVSLQSNYVAGDADVVTHLNNDRTALTNGVNNVRGVFSGGVQSSGQIKSDTVGEENMADDANSRIRTAEGASCTDLTYTGLLSSTTSGTLVGSVPAGTGYPSGYRVVKSGATAHTFTASKWTWVDMDIAGSFTFVEQAIGSATPSVTANSMRISRVSTDATQISAVQDLRITNCSTGPFENFADASGEATLGDVLVKGEGGWANGLNLVSYDATSVTVRPGAAYISGDYKALLGSKTVSITTAGNSLTGIDGLDSGAVGATTTYYLYATADIDATKPPIMIFSSNATTPTGPIKFRRIGEATTDAGSGFTATSADVTSVSYLGKIRQIKMRETGLLSTGTTQIPHDNTKPQKTEGDQVMQLGFTPVSQDNSLVVDVGVQFNPSAANEVTAALFLDNDDNAIAVGNVNEGTNESGYISIHHKMNVPSVAAHTFKVRLGGQGATIAFNGGDSQAAKYNGTFASYLKITEYEA